MITTEIKAYNDNLQGEFTLIVQKLAEIIDNKLAGANGKIWHGHPVWFIDENPIVGYSLQKKGIRLMFWSGIDFNEEKLNVHGKKFKDASIFYNNVVEIDTDLLQNWLVKATNIQWDYKNLIKRKGNLIKLTSF